MTCPVSFRTTERWDGKYLKWILKEYSWDKLYFWQDKKYFPVFLKSGCSLDNFSNIISNLIKKIYIVETGIFLLNMQQYNNYSALSTGIPKNINSELFIRNVEVEYEKEF